MNAIAKTTTSAAPAATRALPVEPHPSFLGSVGGEVLKLRRQGMVWAMLGLALFFFAVVSGALTQADALKQQLARSPATFVFNLYGVYLTLFDTGSGIFLLIVSARLVGMEYSDGTIRVLLARGAGRLRLLLAKLTVLALLGLVLLAGFMTLAAAAVYATVVGWSGSLDKVGSVPALWTDLGINVLIALASIALSILIGTAAAVLGRSLAFGLGAALLLYPADNLVTVVMTVFQALTHQELWLKVPAYLLGPNLNVLPRLMQTDHVAHPALAVPLTNIDATHAWLVIGAWAVALAAMAVWLTWRRDVLQ